MIQFNQTCDQPHTPICAYIKVYHASAVLYFLQHWQIFSATHNVPFYGHAYTKATDWLIWEVKGLTGVREKDTCSDMC